MKKIAAVIVLIAAVLLLASGGFVLATAFTGGTYTVYTDALAEEEYNLNIFQAYFKTVVEQEQGVSVRFHSPDDAEELIKVLNAKFVSVDYYDSFTVTTYYTPLIRNSKTVNGEKVNLQIAVRDDGTVTAGTPLILGSY